MNFTQAREYLGVKSPSVLYRLFHEHGMPWEHSPHNPQIRLYRVTELDRLRKEAGLAEKSA